MTTQDTPTPDQRAAFEAHFSKPPFEWEFSRYGEDSAWPGNYQQYEHQCAWEGYQAGRAALQAQDREDAARLDWLDSMNAKLNSHYGTTYRWELVLSPNVVRLMTGYGGSGHVAAIDLNDSEANGVPSCREAIDHARRIEGGGE